MVVTEAAAAYRLFSEGHGPNEAVIALEQSPSTMKRLYQDYLDGKNSVLIPAGLWARIQQSFLRPGLTPEQLLTWVQSSIERQLELEEELAKFQFPCSVCGEAVRAESATWEAVLESNALSAWAHGDCC